MIDFTRCHRLSELSALDEDEIEDAEFRGKDRAWASIVRLFEERKEHEGLTLEQLGDRVGRSRTQIHRWLSSPMKMTLLACGLLAEGLDADLVIDVVARPRDNPLSNEMHESESAKAWLAVEFKSVICSAASTRASVSAPSRAPLVVQ